MSDKVLQGFCEVTKFLNCPCLDRFTSSGYEMEARRKDSFLHCEKMSSKPILLKIRIFLYTKRLLCSQRSIFSILGRGKHWSLEPFCSADPVKSSQIWKAALSEQNESCYFQAVTATNRSFSRNNACS